MEIVINSVTFENDFYGGAIQTGYLFGNVGDLIKVSINFTPPTAGTTAARFNFGLIKNGANEYPDTNTNIIPQSFFQNPQTGDLQSFTGSAGGALNPSIPYSFNTGTVNLTDLGAGVFLLVHEFILPPFITEGNTDTNPPSAPDYFTGSECLRYIFELNTFDVLINPVPQDTTNGYNKSASFLLGNTGYFNEFFNTAQVNYNLLSKTYAGPINNLENTLTTGQIKNNLGAFLSTDDLILVVGFIPPTMDQNISYSANYQLERIAVKADGVFVNGTLAQNITVNIDGDNTIVNFSFDFFPNDNTNLFWFWQVSTSTTTAQNQNVYGDFLTVDALTDISKIVLLKPDGVIGLDGFRFYKWWTFDDTKGHNQHKQFRSDDGHVKFRINTGSAAVNTLNFGVKNRLTGVNVPGESFSITAAQLPFLQSRNNVRATSNIKNSIEVQELTPGIISFSYGFNIINNWAQNELIFYVSISGTIGGEAFLKEFQSVDFEIGEWEITQNGAGEPQALPKAPIAIEYFLADGAGAILNPTNLGGIVAGQNTRIKVTFEENNLNDLERLESELLGYIYIKPETLSAKSGRYFYTNQDTDPNTPWFEVPAATPQRVLLTKTDIKTATLEAVIRWSQLAAIWPAAQLQDLCVVARLDSFDNFDITIKYIGFHFRNDLNALTFQINEAVTSAEVIEIFGGIPLASCSFFYNTADLWPAPTQYTIDDWKAVINTASPGDWIRITTSAASFVDGLILVQYVTATAAPLTFSITVDIPKGLDQDFAIPLPAGDGIQLSSVTGTNVVDVQGKAIAAGPLTANWVDYSQNDLLVSTAPINTELNAVNSVDHALLINAAYVNNAQTAQVVINGTFDALASDYEGISDSFINMNYRPALNINAKVYDGANDYDVINGFNQTQFNANTPFSILCVFYNNNFLSDITGSQRLFSTNPFPFDLGNIELAYGQSTASFAELRITDTGGNFLRALGLMKLGFNTCIVTYDGSRTANGLNLYMNGTYNEFIPKTAALVSTTVNAQNDFMIGKYSTSLNGGFLGRRYNGYMSKLSIINRVLTPQEVRETYINGFINELTSNFILKVDFNQTGAAPLIDTGANAYTINNFGGAAYVPFYSL